MTIICTSCRKECEIINIDESFDYAGTHCTGGKPGTHHIEGPPVSDCCHEPTEEACGWEFDEVDKLYYSRCSAFTETYESMTVHDGCPFCGRKIVEIL